MKLLSWNINGIRSVNNKNVLGDKIKNNEPPILSVLINQSQADIICLQEVKCSAENVKEFDLYKDTYPHIFLNCSKARKGYSGVAILSKEKPLNVYYEYELLGDGEMYDFLQEGRLITLEYETIFVVCCYTPNSKTKLERLEQRINAWEPLFRRYIQFLQRKKSIVLCGDLNVAHTDLDIHSAKGHTRSAGFTKEERAAFSSLLEECNLIDTFRDMYPKEKKYTYFSNFAKSRERNKGWRIDYTLVSKKIKNKIKQSEICSEIVGSDHVPIMVEMEL